MRLFCFFRNHVDFFSNHWYYVIIPQKDFAAKIGPKIRQEVIKELIRSRIGASRDVFSKITVKEAAYIKSRSNHVQSALYTSVGIKNSVESDSAEKPAANG